MILGISLVLIVLGLVFLILGLYIANKGDVWGIMLATIGLPIFGTIWAFCLYEIKRRIKIKESIEQLNEKIDILLFESNIKKTD